MKKETTYSGAYSKLEDLVDKLEEANIPLEKLSATVKQANELILICENKLRKIDTEVKSTITNNI
jgi:exodeoxyribonuclease VII small subunit